MKATGIVRRIDDLGRIVIPKEIRKTLKIKEGSPLEIFTTSEGDIIFKKYSPVGEMEGIVDIYTQTLSTMLACTCIVTDTDKVISVSGSSKKDLIGKNISDGIREFIFQKKILMSKDSISICDGREKKSELIAVILSSGEPIGAIILSDLKDKESLDTIKILKLTATLIGKQTE